MSGRSKFESGAAGVGLVLAGGGAAALPVSSPGAGPPPHRVPHHRVLRTAAGGGPCTTGLGRGQAFFKGWEVGGWILPRGGGQADLEGSFSRFHVRQVFYVPKLVWWVGGCARCSSWSCQGTEGSSFLFRTVQLSLSWFWLIGYLFWFGLLRRQTFTCVWPLGAQIRGGGSHRSLSKA